MDTKQLTEVSEEKDWFLQMLVSMANNTENIKFSMGITLACHGFLISGELMSMSDYFDAFANDFSKVIPTSGELQEAISNLGKPKNDSTEPLPPPVYIHLKGAKMFYPNQKPIPNNTGINWRGRISEIGGFMLGSLSVD